MSKQATINKIIRAAKKDVRLRNDPRFLRTMGFLVAKGFLRSNQDIQLLPNLVLELNDAIWAGLQVELRILEVLPAAVLRLPKHFRFRPNEHPEFVAILSALRSGASSEIKFHGFPLGQLSPWLELKLVDGRAKGMSERKITKTFRLTPRSISILNERAKMSGNSQAAVLEQLLMNSIQS